MTYRWLEDLDQALAAAGVPYVEVGPAEADYTGAADWRTRGRPASTGPFDPCGVLCHHTASPAGTSDQADLNAILWGNSSAPGPISQLLLGRSGTLYIVAAGRANHGGSGVRPELDSDCEDMNAATIGIEASNNGVGERWSDPMCEMYAATVAALIAWYGWTTAEVYLHATTGPPGGGCNSKIDPAGPWTGQPHLVGSATWDLDLWRQFITDRRQPPNGGDDTVTDDDIQAIAERVWQVALHNYQAGDEQAAQFLMGFAHAEAYDGSFRREVENMVDGTRRQLGDMVRFAHYEAATANAKLDQVLAHLQRDG